MHMDLCEDQGLVEKSRRFILIPTHFPEPLCRELFHELGLLNSLRGVQVRAPSMKCAKGVGFSVGVSQDRAKI